MFPNILKQEAQMATRLRLPQISYDAVTNMLKNSRVAASLTQFKNNAYERAIGQHLHKSATPHDDPTRFGDFEVRGRVSDF
ncbi:unnamed protein product [Chironomus riparius]|uniref:Uncharacterized protein n=1 Tax=Chironomus riparius TaxID=315576 RepID=A0A9N9RJP9_9DIPT|nr:unnamed protein product [Chironomus riparius]